MESKALLNILVQAGKLKKETRHCFLDSTRKESVADHSWRVALMAFLLEDEFSHLDIKKVMTMCLIHDLGESFTGDIPTFEKGKKESKKEEEILMHWIQTFPEPTRSNWIQLFHEMNEQKTQEAKLYKALDKLEAILSHDESDIETWLDLEYELQYQYGRKECEFSEYLSELHDEIDQWTDQKIAQKKVG